MTHTNNKKDDRPASKYRRDRKDEDVRAAEPKNDKGQIGAVAGTGAGMAAGAAIGSIVPGVGTAIGAIVGGAIGAVTGGIGGAAIGASIDSSEHEAYWREHYASRPYSEGLGYDELEPAYRYGWEARARNDGQSRWGEVEEDLARDWETTPSEPRLDWKRARLAARDAWERVDPRAPTGREP